MKFLLLHPHVAAFVAAWVLADIITPFMRYLAIRMNVMDAPRARKIHAHPTPRLGGVAIFIAFTLSVLSTLDYTVALLAIVGAGFFIAAMGLADDLFSVPATVKFIFLFIVILVLGIVFDIHVRVPFDYVPLNIVLTAFWMVYVMSCFNAIDNMDGLAAGVTFLCSGAFYMISFGTDQSSMGYIAICLAGSCFGFLRYNTQPASIFMGDSGAFFIGFIIASMAIIGVWAGPTEPVKAVVVPVLVLSFPLYDLFYTTLMRYKNKKVKTLKEAVMMSAKDHTSHRLQLLFSLSHRETVLACYLLCAVPAALAVISSVFIPAYSVFFFFIVAAFFAVVGTVLGRAKPDYSEDADDMDT